VSEFKKRVDATLTIFREQEPWEPHQPLMLGISKALREAFPELDKRHIGCALGHYTSSLQYLRALAHGQPRLDLDGVPGDPPSEEDRQAAAEQLAEQLAAREQRRVATEQGRKDAKLQPKWDEALARARQARLAQEARKAERQAQEEAERRAKEPPPRLGLEALKAPARARKQLAVAS